MASQRVFIPFGEWNPDPPEFSFGGLSMARNVVPDGNGYSGWDVPSQIVASTMDNPNSLYFHRYRVLKTLSSQNYTTDHGILVIGGLENLGTVDSANTYTDRTRASADYGQGSLLPFPWSFQSWGNKVVAVNWADPIQVWECPSAVAPGAGAFDDIAATEADPQAKFISSLGQHLVIANINLPGGAYGSLPADLAWPNSATVWWSRTDSEVGWSDETNQPSWNSGYQPLVDLPGEITGLAKVGEDNLLIFKRTGIFVMTRTGGTDLFAFRVLCVGTGYGTIHPGSIVVTGHDVYYWNSNGEPMVISGLNLPVSIATGRVSRFLRQTGIGTLSQGAFLPEEDPTVHAVTGLQDPITENIIWSYQGRTGQDDPNPITGGYPKLIFNPFSSRFTLALEEVDSDSPWTNASAADDDGHVYIDRDGVLYSSNSEFYEEVVRAFKTKILNLQPEEPMELGIGAGTHSIIRVRPIFEEVGGTEYSIVIEYTDDMQQFTGSPFDPVRSQTLTDDHRVSQGWFYPPTKGKCTGCFFRFTVETNGNAQGPWGLEVEFESSGSR